MSRRSKRAVQVPLETTLANLQAWIWSRKLASNLIFNQLKDRNIFEGSQKLEADKRQTFQKKCHHNLDFKKQLFLPPNWEGKFHRESPSKLRLLRQAIHRLASQQSMVGILGLPIFLPQIWGVEVTWSNE